MHEATGEIPDALQNKPELSRWTAEYYSAFNVLSDSRKVLDGGIGAIPVTEVFAYMQMFNIGTWPDGRIKVDEREHFIKMIKTLDRAYIKHINARLKQDRDKQARAAKSGARVPRRR